MMRAVPATSPVTVGFPYAGASVVNPAVGVVGPAVDYWGPGWVADAPNYQWEMQNLRRELDWAYGYVPGGIPAHSALQSLQEEERRWRESQLHAQHAYAGEAYERLRQAEARWHDALRQSEMQRYQVGDLGERVRFMDAESRATRGSLTDQLNWHRQQLARAQEEIQRLRPANAHFSAVTSEVEYLRAQVAGMRQLEERFANVSKEADMLRAQLVKQEHNIDRYTHQTESFYQSANSENVQVKKALGQREDELRHLRERFKDAVDEITHSHEQVKRAEAELKRVRAEADDLHDFVSEAIYLKHQYGDASKQLARMDDRLESLAAENDHLQSQLEDADKEIERLTVALEDETTKHRFLEAALNEEIADNKTVRRQLNEAVVHQTHVASAFKSDAKALSSDAQVKQMEIDRLQTRVGELTAELEKYTAMYQEAVVDVDRLKAALTEEITEHKYARGLADQQKRKADLAIEELERIGGPAAMLRSQLADAESQVIHLRNVIAEQRMEIERLAHGPIVREIIHDPVTIGYHRGDPVVKAPMIPGQRFAYFGVEVAEGAFLSKSYGEGHPIPAVRVVNVGGPCQSAGLRPGDLISSIKGRQVGSLDDFNAIVSSIAPHTEVKIIFERDGVLLGTDIVTEETKREPGMPGQVVADDHKPRRKAAPKKSR